MRTYPVNTCDKCKVDMKTDRIRLCKRCKPRLDQMFTENLALAYRVLSDVLHAHSAMMQFYEDLESAAQQGLWLACLRYGADHQGELSTFAYPTIWGTIVSHYAQIVRKRSKLPTYTLTDLNISEHESESVILDRYQYSEQAFDRVAHEDWLKTILKPLKQRNRKILRRYLEGESYNEIARRFRCSRQNIQQIIAFGLEQIGANMIGGKLPNRKKIRQLLREHGPCSLVKLTNLCDVPVPEGERRTYSVAVKNVAERMAGQGYLKRTNQDGQIIYGMTK